VGRRRGARRHQSRNSGPCSAPRRSRNRQALWRHRAGHRKGLYTPRSRIREHISHEAIGYSLDWFSRTLQGGTPRPSDDQIWFAKEIGTLIALIGFVALLIGVFDGCWKRPCSRT